MAISPQHELHRRRLSRNIGVGSVLGALVILFFALSIVKVTYQGPQSEAPAATGTTAAPAATGTSAATGSDASPQAGAAGGAGQ